MKWNELVRLKTENKCSYYISMKILSGLGIKDNQMIRKIINVDVLF